MDQDDMDNDNYESVFIGKYDSGRPLPHLSTTELFRCGVCDGLYRVTHFGLVVGMYLQPTNYDANSWRKKADEHNQKLDELFDNSKKCTCEERQDSH